MKKFTHIAAGLALAVFLVPALASAQSGPACYTNMALYGTAGSYSFTVPSGVTQLRTLAIGGGGGGGAGSGGWGSGGGGGCGGGIAAGTISVTPGQKIDLFVGYGGTGGNGSTQTGAGGCPWCGSYNPGANGSVGGNSGIGSIVAQGGSWGRTGYYNLYNNYTGGHGGGSGGGGGGNGWPGFQAYVTSGGTAGSNDPNNASSAGGYCIGDGWSVDPGQYITKVPWSPGVGGQEPYVTSYYGGGGGGGIVINNSTVNGHTAPGGCPWGCPGTGGAGYGGGGGGQGVDYQGAGGAGAQGAVYIEWDGGGQNSCALSCAINFAQNPLTGNSTTIHWTSTNAEFFYINGIGYVSASGQTQVYAGGDYSGYVSGIGSSATCPAVLQSNNDCSPDSYVCSADGNLHNSCNQTQSCQYGCSTATNQCNTSCQHLPVCDAAGSKVVNVCNGTTLQDCASEGKSCVSGACVLAAATFTPFDATRDGVPFTATGHLQVLPSLVRSGDPTHVYWNVGHASSCIVSGSNGDSWTDVFSGSAGKATPPITGQTTYTLHCDSLPGALPASVNESATVSILPVFQER